MDEVQQPSIANNPTESDGQTLKARVGSVVPAKSTNETDEPELSEEEKDYQQLLAPFLKYPKLKKWVELFTDKNNPKTYGNRTESAMQAYDCKSRAIAASIGAQNYRKLNGLASMFGEDRGVNVQSMLEVLAARALTDDKAEWWKLAASVFGVFDPKAPSIVVNNNTQNNTQVNVDGKAIQDFNADFRKFVESQ